MASRPRVGKFTGKEASRQILDTQSDDEISSIFGDETASDNENHFSEMSDHS